MGIPSVERVASIARSGSPGEMRPDSPRYARRVRLWKRLPLWLTRWVGPHIVRGIP